VLSSKLFYTIYPDLLTYKDSITLLGEHPENSSLFGVSNTKENIYTKKFIVIQNGCDNYCSFCLTVQKRGKHISRSREDIVQEINEFSQL